MAISNGGYFEVDAATGDDSLNAGYFNADGAGAGTDYSLPANGPLSFTDLVIDATSNLKVKSSGTAATTAWFRNGLRITAGSGFTTGLYEVTNTAIDGSGFVTLDRACGTVSSSGGTGRLGGPLASIGGQAAVMGATDSGHLVYLKYNASSYAHTSTANVAGGRWAKAGAGIRIVGYNTTRTLHNTDANRPTLISSSNSMTIVTMGATGVNGLANLIFDNTNSNTSMTQASLGGALAWVRNCKFKGSTTTGLSISAAYSWIEDVWFDANSGTSALTVSSSSAIARIRVTSCTATDGVVINNTAVQTAVDDSVIEGFSGGTAAWNVQSATGRALFRRCSGRVTGGSDTSVFRFNSVNAGVLFEHCIAAGATGTGKGFLLASGSQPEVHIRNCAGYNNNGGNYDASTGEVTNFVALSADPWTNAGGGDFSLNNTAGGGAAARGIVYSFPGTSTYASYQDGGAVQHQDAGAGGGLRLAGHGGLAG